MRRRLKNLCLQGLTGIVVLTSGDFRDSAQVNIKPVKPIELNIKYDKASIQIDTPDGTYERYEHTGHDSVSECIEVVTLREMLQDKKFVTRIYKGMDNVSCDEKLDAFSIEIDDDKIVVFCDDGHESFGTFYDCILYKKKMKMFKEDNNIDSALQRWRERRDSCDKSHCYMALAPARSMSKKKVK